MGMLDFHSEESEGYAGRTRPRVEVLSDNHPIVRQLTRYAGGPEVPFLVLVGPRDPTVQVEVWASLPLGIDPIDVSNPMTKAWLESLVAAGLLERRT